MTKDQVRVETERALSEFYDGYILIGRIAGQRQFIFAHHIPDLRTKDALSATMEKAVAELKHQPHIPD